MADFAFINFDVRVRLFKQYCMNFYGSSLYNVDCKIFRDLCTQFRKALRRILRIPCNTHKEITLLLADLDCLEEILSNRVIKFNQSLYYHKNEVIKTIKDSVFNFRNFRAAGEIVKGQAFLFSSFDSEIKVRAIRDLIYMLEGTNIGFFNGEECNDFVKFLCTV